ncbi:MAG TPA: helicase-related protein, partial [Thermomicrobiales bacterium]|nr:helicase-related protein [Thermomicrobiales bacterium]
FHEEERWISRYGIWEETRKKARRDVEVLADGAQSDRKEYTSVVLRERPGIHPGLLLRLLPSAVFINLADVAPHLPPYREYPVVLDMAPEQRSMYLDLERQLHEALMAALQAGSKRLLGAYLQTLLSWPDNPRAEAVADGPDGAVAASVAGLPLDRDYPKEEHLLDLADDARRRGRRTLVYCTHTGSRDLTARLARLLTGRGHRVATLRAESVPAERREAWVEARVAEGIGVLIANPRCVETGLDLLAFGTIIWMELDYSTYVLRQASRRSWRIGQESDVEVHYLCYAETLQASALALMQAKIRASLLLEGELPEGGLTGEVDDDLFAQLARQLAAGAPGGLDALFTDTHGAELQADAFLEAAFLGDDEPEAGSENLAAGGAIEDDWQPPALAGRSSTPRPLVLVSPEQPGDTPPPVHGGQLPLFAAPAAGTAGDHVSEAVPPPRPPGASQAGDDAVAAAGRRPGGRTVSWEELAALALAERRQRRARPRPSANSPQAGRLPLT